jgi:hypothetical protein
VLRQARRSERQAARISFASANAITPSVDILWNLAAAERRADHTVESLEHLRAYLASPEARADRKPTALDWIAELEAKTGTVTVTAPKGATVTVDGVVATSRPMVLTAGVHAFVITQEGKTRSYAVDVVAGTTTTHVASLVDAPALAKPPSPPSAAAAKAATVSSGSSTSTSTSTIAISPRTWATIGFGASAVLSLGGAIFFSIEAAGARDDADVLHARVQDSSVSCKRAGTLCTDYDDARSRADRFGALATGLYAVGGVLGGASIVSFLLWPRDKKDTVITPVASPSGAGLRMVGTF